MLEDQPTGLKLTNQDSLLLNRRNQGSNHGHLELQSNALPNELFLHINIHTIHIKKNNLKSSA